MTVVVPSLSRHLTGWMTARELFIQTQGEEPLEWQEAYLRETRDTVVLKGRQVGASTSGSVIAIRRARYYPGSLVAIVSPSLKQSTEVKERAKSGLLAIGEHLVRDSSSVLELTNRSRILSLPGSAKSVRGWSADLLIIDEAAFLDEETFVAARATTAATGGRTIVQSTPMGPFGSFHDLWKDPDPRWAKFRVRSDEVRTITPEFLARERATMTPEKYTQEYEADFTNPGLGLIDPARLESLTGDAPPVPDNVPDIWGRIAG
jgi:hypothetical protein